MRGAARWLTATLVAIATLSGVSRGQSNLDSPEPLAANFAFGLLPESRPFESLEDEAEPLPPPAFGPAPVYDAQLLTRFLGLEAALKDRGLRLFGWMETGYSGASSGSGLLATAPPLNRFGNEFLVNQIGLTLQKPLDQEQFDVGFNIRYLAGSDAAVLAGDGGINRADENSRFSHDFADLYVSAHLPILTQRGMDVKFGRMQTIIGFNGALAPYRPFYSSDYQFFYSQDGAFTGLLTNLHVSDQLDVWNGVTLGANTFFTKRSSNSICYLVQANYWLTTEHRTMLTASIYAGPDALVAAPGRGGDFVTVVELRVQHHWTDRFTQVIQSNLGSDANTPTGTANWYGLYTIGIVHLNRELDGQLRLEWFDDADGSRTGIDTNYAECTLGLNWHPYEFLEFRPEVRGDFAGAPAFGSGDVPRDRAQFTGGVSALLKF